MLYELSLVTKSDLPEAELGKITAIVNEVVKAHDGEVFSQDDWGKLNFAQPTSEGVQNGHFTYFVFTANNVNNVELARRFKINEGVMRSLIVKVADTAEDKDEFLKNLKIPYSKTFSGSVTDKEGEDGTSIDKEKKSFSRRRSCWFAANQIKADWKDPKTFGWLVNEFGKISPARISGISRKHQRFAQVAIKRARQIGIASFISNRIAD